MNPLSTEDKNRNVGKLNYILSLYLIKNSYHIFGMITF